MKKLLLLSLFIAVSAALPAHAFMSQDDVLSYTAMPLAVSDVCDVRGVQTDQVGLLVTQMNRAGVSPDAFADVFRYVPVALVLNSGHRPDFVQWVGSEVDRGIVGDELVTVMEQRLTSYGNVVTVSRVHRRHHYYRPAYRSVLYEEDYVPTRVVRYCDHALLDPFALIDMPIAVAQVVDMGVPIARVGGLVAQLNLGYVAPLQQVEVLRYSAPALLATDYGYPDFVQYVTDQRVSGLSGYDLVRVVDQRLPVYGVTPQIDLAAPVYIGQNSYVPSVVSNYVAPFDPAFVPQVVRTRIASAYAPGAIASQPAPALAAAPSPQVQRLLGQQGSAVVTNPAQARREIAQQMKVNKHEGRGAAAVAGGFVAPQVAPQLRTHGGGRMHVAHSSMPVMRPQKIARPHNVPHAQHVQHVQMAHPHGRPQFTPQPRMVMPPQVHQKGGHGQGHVGGPPQRVMPPPQVQQQGPGQAHGQGQGHGQKKGKG